MTFKQVQKYGAIAIAIVGIVVLALNVAVLSSYYRATGGALAIPPAPLAVGQSAAPLGDPKDAPPMPVIAHYVHGMVKAVNGFVITIDTGGETRNVSLTSETKIILDQGAAKGRVAISADRIPLESPAQITISEGSDSIASQVVVVKIHD